MCGVVGAGLRRLSRCTLGRVPNLPLSGRCLGRVRLGLRRICDFALGPLSFTLRADFCYVVEPWVLVVALHGLPGSRLLGGLIGIGSRRYGLTALFKAPSGRCSKLLNRGLFRAAGRANHGPTIRVRQNGSFLPYVKTKMLCILIVGHKIGSS